MGMTSGDLSHDGMAREHEGGDPVEMSVAIAVTLLALLVSHRHSQYGDKDPRLLGRAGE